MTSKWCNVDEKEKARRLIDLVLISVLLDAGAGDSWKYKEPGTDSVFTRSEGLGIASLHMFCSGSFSSTPESMPHRVDADALINLANNSISIGFQVVSPQYINHPHLGGL